MGPMNGSKSTMGGKPAMTPGLYTGNMVTPRTSGSAIASKTALSSTPATPVLNAKFRDPSNF